MSLAPRLAERARGPRAAIIEPVGTKGGMQFYDLGLGQALARTGAAVSLYTCGVDARSERDGLHVYRAFDGVWKEGPLPLRALRFARASLSSLAHARRARHTLVHFHFFGAGPREAFLVGAARRQRLRVVITAHDVADLAVRNRTWLARGIYGVAHAIIVHNRLSYDEIARLHAVPTSSLHVIPHGNYLPYVSPSPSRSEARARLGLAANGPLLLFFGQIKRVKGLDMLLRALPAILHERPDAQVMIAGSVWKDDFGRYRALIAELGMGAHVKCRIGYVADEEVGNYFAASDLAVLPYRRIYQSGVLLLAMSHACPVLVSDIPGMTEIVTHGDNGLVFRNGDVADLAERALAALSVRDQLGAVGRRGRNYVRAHHDWDDIARRTADVYRAVD